MESWGRRGGREEGDGGDDDSARSVRKQWEHHSHMKSHTNRVLHVYVRQQIKDLKGA